MRVKLLILLGLFPLVIMLQGCKPDFCKGYINNYTITATIKPYLFNIGTYWIYQDSATLETDSQYILNTMYSYDTVNQPGPSGSSCGPTIYEAYIMTVQETIGSYPDTFYFSVDATWIGIINSMLDTGAIFYNAGTQPIACLTKEASYNQLKIGSNYFNNVIEFRITSNCTGLFPNGIDIYSAPNWGIVKRVEYNSSGIEIHSWNLKRWHILQ